MLDLCDMIRFLWVGRLVSECLRRTRPGGHRPLIPESGRTDANRTGRMKEKKLILACPEAQNWRALRDQRSRDRKSFVKSRLRPMARISRRPPRAIQDDKGGCQAVADSKFSPPGVFLRPARSGAWAGAPHDLFARSSTGVCPRVCVLANQA